MEPELEPTDAQLHAAGGIADEEGDVEFLKEYLNRAGWRRDVPDDIFDAFLEMVYGSGR